MSHPGVPPTSAPQGWAKQPPPPQRDSTRTLAIVALVVAGIALVGQLATSVLPMLFFGVFGVFGLFGLSEDFPEDEMRPPTGVVTIGGGQVSPAADGTVSAAALTSAVRELIGTDDPYLAPADAIRCDAAPRVSRDSSVLRRAPSDGWYFIVRFANGLGDFEVHAVDRPDMMP